MTKTPGVEDYVTHGETGVLVAPRSPLAFAQAVIDLLTNPGHAETLGTSGREKVEREHRSKDMARHLAMLVR
jgi:glycosyltransferase involved in cell wall biosynthesis